MGVMLANNLITVTADHQAGMSSEEFWAMAQVVILTVKISITSRKHRYFSFGWGRVILLKMGAAIKREVLQVVLQNVIRRCRNLKRSIQIVLYIAQCVVPTGIEE